MRCKATGVLTIGMMLALGSHNLRSEAQTPEVCSEREMVPAQVRLSSCRTAALVASGMRRSATLRGVIDRVGTLKGIVYIEDRYYVNGQTRRVLSGALSHQITTAGAYRVLHLIVAPESGDRRLLTMAHELQHAIEVLEAGEVATAAAVDQLFERIGTHTSAGIVETPAALEVERAVGRELSVNRESRSDTARASSSGRAKPH